MKHLIKLAFITVLCLGQWSCNNDDDASATTLSETHKALIGEWLRSDNLINPNVEYKINLTDNNGDGLITDLRTTDDGVISSAKHITWSTHDDILNITLDSGEVMTTSILFLDNGNMILSNITELPFIKQ